MNANHGILGDEACRHCGIIGILSDGLCKVCFQEELETSM